MRPRSPKLGSCEVDGLDPCERPALLLEPTPARFLEWPDSSLGTRSTVFMPTV
jgi:hypothetical protein